MFVVLNLSLIKSQKNTLCFGWQRHCHNHL
jgi:hypothetical protein